MKIGILTVPFNNNYGGYLQAFALMSVLKQMGHEPTLIMRRQNKRRMFIKAGIKYFIMGIYHSFKNKKMCPLIYKTERDFEYLGSNMHQFVDKRMLPQSPYLYTSEDLKRYCDGKFGAYIVGSDQVWRAIYVPDIANYFLDFTSGWNVKRIAYAASFGTQNPEYTQEEKKVCCNMIPKFDAISLREKTGKHVFANFGWEYKNLEVVLDPTLLLNSSDYTKLLPNEKEEINDGIFYYVLDKNQYISNIINDIQEKNKKKTYGISNIQCDYKPLPSIENWLTYIKNASFVVTDSFHGMVFAIIFNKPFLVLVNGTRGADRFLNMLSLLDLQDRVLSDDLTLNEILEKEIDWDSVNTKLSILREKSLKFLEHSLS